MTPTLHFTQFGKYNIIRKFGRSMSDVYLAHDPEIDRKLVLKIVEQCHDPLTQLIVDAERRGASIQQQLHNIDPRILEIYEFGEQNGCFFVAMRYVEGKSIAELLRDEKRLEPTTAARFAAEICSQLTSLHAFHVDLNGQTRAVVHGDIKPSNVQVDGEGNVWLLDFGIAKVISATRNLTQHNLGSPAYCSPERVKSGSVEPQSDLWATGVCLYEMLTGMPPYQAQTTRKLENLIQSGRPPRALPETCPPRLAAIVRRAIAGDPERRYTTAQDFERDLRSFLAGKETIAETERTPSWEMNQTIEKPRSSVPETRHRPWFGTDRLITLYEGAGLWLLAGLLVGAFLSVPISRGYWLWTASAPIRVSRDYSNVDISNIERDWKLYRSLQRDLRALSWFPPIQQISSSMESRLLSTADQVLFSFRNSSIASIAAFDWKKAQLCLRHVAEMNPSNSEVKGKLALCDGYSELLDASRAPAVAELSFRNAADAWPNSPDPHLGLARVYTYNMQKVGQSIAELNVAERLGYKVGPREQEILADGYLQRAERSLRQLQSGRQAGDKQKLLAGSKRDLERARSAYEPIAEYSNVSRNLQRLEKSELLAERLQAHWAGVRKHTNSKVRYARWR